MYDVLLIIHSWLRYAVLVLGAWLLWESVRCLRANTLASVPGRLYAGFLGVLDLQLLIGLSLYFVFSPITALARLDLAEAMKDPQLRFFGVEHITTMLLAVGVAHVGRVISKRRQGRAQAKAICIAQVCWLLLTLAAIPWPGLDIARPLFRL